MASVLFKVTPDLKNNSDNGQETALACEKSTLWTLTVFLSCLLLMLAALVARRSRASRTLPGPWSVPGIGTPCLFFSRDILSTMASFRRKHGDLFRVKIGNTDVLVLNGLATVRKALVDQATTFAGRPPLLTFQKASEGKSMVFNSYSPQWKAHRKLAERAIKLGVKSCGFLDSTIDEEFTSLLEKLKSYEGCAINPEKDIIWAVARAKYRLCYGNCTGEDFIKMVEKTLQLIGCHNRGNLLNFFPWARVFMSHLCREIEDVCHDILRLTRKEEARHLETFESGRIRDCLDALIEIGVRRPCVLEPDHVMHTVQEYLGAGLDIVYLTISWTVLYMAVNPDVQKRVQDEIDVVMGKNRKPTVALMNNMHYTHACVHEVLRHSTAVPFALPHSTIKDTSLNGWQVPTNTFVLVNLYSINRDSELWEDPFLFKPDRFLKNGIINPELASQYSAFGIGRRQCVGENISRTEVFLFLVKLLQKFNVTPVDHVTYSLDPIPGVVLRPRPYKVHFKAR